MGNGTAKNKPLLTALVANRQGEIFELEGYAAVAMAGRLRQPMQFAETRNLPHGSELMMLPDRHPILYNINKRRFETLLVNPHKKDEPVFPVAAFNSPGFVVSGISAYEENQRAGYLPLFSYGAVGWHRGKFRSAVFQVDREKRQDLRQMQASDVRAGIQVMRRQMPSNRLRAHLEKCALTYGCPAGKNFFLGRYEAPLPTAQRCNARCLGCLSLQKNNRIPHSQNRITFTPAPEEIAEVALAHIARVKNGVVSFGQGCEGDPLMAADVIEKAIRQIRSETGRGTINLNTNGSRPDLLERLFDAGLDSMRVSLNSVRETPYHAYFRPKGYCFSDVVRGIDMAVGRGRFVSINYLNCPGFTDTPDETKALMRFMRQHPVSMIQWRNLNFDPLRYWQAMAVSVRPMGMQRLFESVCRSFPDLKHGYFNPPKEKF